MSTINTTNLKNPSSATNNIVLNADGSITTQRDLTLLTAKAWNWNSLTTNTLIDFTDIPSWAKRVTVILSEVSTSGTSDLLLRIGDGAIVTTGYTSGMWQANTNNFGSTAGFLSVSPVFAAAKYTGAIALLKLTGNTWVASGTIAETSAPASFGGGNVMGGSKTLSGALDRIRVTSVNGTDTFDAGSINIMYE